MAPRSNLVPPVSAPHGRSRYASLFIVALGLLFSLLQACALARSPMLRDAALKNSPVPERGAAFF